MDSNPSAQCLPAVAILGPTASGKTGLALTLAEQGYPVEIISLDSALVYRDMNIGTAKPSAQELAAVPHHLVDIISPMAVFNASEFAEHCLRLIQEIRARNKVPLIVGGTMMYFKTLVSGMDDLPAANPILRAQIEANAQRLGWPALHAQLQALDPPTAARLKPTDAQRIERALEVVLGTGRPLSDYHTRGDRQLYSLPTLSLEPADRGLLHDRIGRRFADMLSAGFLEEVKQLRTRYPLNPELPSMRCVGYRQAWMHLEGQLSASEWIEAGVAATRQLAKRQLTWLRSIEYKQVVDPFDSGAVTQGLSWLHSRVMAVMNTEVPRSF